MPKYWKHYYTRPTALQDFEMPVVRSGFYLLRNRVHDCIYVPVGNNNWESWYPEPAMGNHLKRLTQTIFKPNWNLAKHQRDFVQASRNLRQAALALGRLAERRSAASQLLRAYKLFCWRYRVYGLFIWMPWGITGYLEPWFVNNLQKKFSNWQELFEAVAAPDKAEQMQLMVEAAWRWYLAGKPRKELQQIVNKYGYLSGYSVNDKTWTAEEIIKQASPLTNCAQRLRGAQSQRAANRRKFKIAYKTILAKDKKLARAAEVIHEYVWLRNERVNAYKYALINTRPFYRSLEKQVGWGWGWAAHLTYDETINHLTGRSIVSSEEMVQRHELQYVAYMTKDRTKVIADIAERNKFIHKMLGQKTDEDITEVSGQIAWPGKVRGKVQVILSSKNVYKFKAGNILVANMTHTDYITAVHKAKAIVTDEGGVVCHAAIVARELKKPCVIGTKIATRVFKDGDRLEVDATKGVVKKIG